MAVLCLGLQQNRQGKQIALRESFLNKAVFLPAVSIQQIIGSEPKGGKDL